MHDGSIGFSIAKNGIVCIKLYNIAGQLTREVFNNYKLAGNYQIFLDTYDLNQGAYILVMETNADKVTKSIIVVK